MGAKLPQPTILTNETTANPHMPTGGNPCLKNP